MRSQRFRRCLGAASLAALALASIPAASADGPPRRVVSVNVCTDQLAMLVAGPGQLASVSYLAGDPTTSAMAAQAKAYPVNHGLAEEIFLLRPDPVLAGTYTTRTTVSMLRRLGIPVEEFVPESSFEDVRLNLLRICGGPFN